MRGFYEFVLQLLFCELIMPLLLAAAGYQGQGGKCPPSFPCGYLENISFPFTKTERQDCGFLPIHNCDDPDPHKPKMIQLQENGKLFQLVRVAQSPPSRTITTFQFRDQNLYDLLQNESCEAFRNNYTIPHSFHFAALRIQVNTTLFRCNRTLHISPPTKMYKNYTKCVGYEYDLYYSSFPNASDASVSSKCTKVQLPIKDMADANNPFTFLTGDINVDVILSDECADCHSHQQGQCQLDSRKRFCCTNGILDRKPWKHKHP